MSIKDRLEKAKEEREAKRAAKKAEKEKQPKKTVRTKVAMAVLGGALTFGAASCGEENAKKDNKSENQTEVTAQKNNTNDTISVKEDALTRRTVNGFPVKKHAENPNDPDSLLVVTNPAGSHTLGGKVYIEGEAEYTPIKAGDKGKDFVPVFMNNGSDKTQSGFGRFDEIGEHPDYDNPDVYTPKKKEMEDINMSATKIHWRAVDRKNKSSAQKSESTGGTEARVAPDWVGSPTSDAYGRVHKDAGSSFTDKDSKKFKKSKVIKGKKNILEMIKRKRASQKG